MKTRAFLRRLVHFLGRDERRHFYIDRHCGVGGKGNGRGTNIVRKISNGKYICLAEGEVQCL